MFFSFFMAFGWNPPKKKSHEAWSDGFNLFQIAGLENLSSSHGVVEVLASRGQGLDPAKKDVQETFHGIAVEGWGWWKSCGSKKKHRGWWLMVSKLSNEKSICFTLKEANINNLTKNQIMNVHRNLLTKNVRNSVDFSPIFVVPFGQVFFPRHLIRLPKGFLAQHGQSTDSWGEDWLTSREVQRSPVIPEVPMTIKVQDLKSFWKISWKLPAWCIDIQICNEKKPMECFYMKKEFAIYWYILDDSLMTIDNWSGYIVHLCQNTKLQ